MAAVMVIVVTTFHEMVRMMVVSQGSPLILDSRTCIVFLFWCRTALFYCLSQSLRDHSGILRRENRNMSGDGPAPS